MRRLTILIMVAATLAQFSCKKNDYQPPPENIIIDPLVNETFGRKLEFDGSSMVTWSADSRNIFVTTADGIYLYNSADNSKELVLQKENNAYLVQVLPDGQNIIILGDVNHRFGYYKLNIASKEVTELLGVGSKKATAVYAGNNDMFIYQGDLVERGRPCESWDDIFCGVYTITINMTLQHKRIDNNSKVELRPDLRFQNYSPDGTQAILSTWDTCFLYNTITQSFEDSLPVSPVVMNANFHWINNSIQYPTFDGISDIVIIDLTSNQEVKRFTTSLSVTEFFGWPAKSNKIFYTGATNGPNYTYAINELDLTTMTEKELVVTSSPDILISPFYVKPSPDGNTIVFNDGYATYIKPVN